MGSQIALFGRTFVIGVAVAAPVGAMGVLCIQRTLAAGRRAGLATGLGIATADALYAGLAAFGLTAVAGALAAWQTPLRVVGGVALVYLGTKAALSAPVARAADEIGPRGMRRTYGGAVALTLANPMTIMAFAAVFATTGLASQPSVAAAAVATAGVACGSLSWWVGLVLVVSLLRHALGDKAVATVNRISGVAVALFGVAAIASAILR